MNQTIFQFIDYKDEKFKQAISLRYEVLFKPYNVEKYYYDELDDKSIHLVAIANNQVIGYSRMTINNDVAKITNVVVNLEYVKKGIGIEMLKRHIANAQKNNVKDIYLNARLETVDFYKKLGFEIKDKVSISEKSGLLLQKMHKRLS
jgi:N-acetylglutamate synthase-like GNAT family acetyltransferase